VNHLSERSTAIAKLALELLVERLKLTYCEGDDPNIARGLSEIGVAISELGPFNNRMTVHYDQLHAAYHRYPPQAHHVDVALCENCANAHMRLMTSEDKCFAEAVMNERVAMPFIDNIIATLQKARQLKS